MPETPLRVKLGEVGLYRRLKVVAQEYCEELPQ
jgi:hypothetical protein